MFLLLTHPPTVHLLSAIRVRARVVVRIIFVLRLGIRVVEGLLKQSDQVLLARTRGYLYVFVSTKQAQFVHRHRLSVVAVHLGYSVPA